MPGDRTRWYQKPLSPPSRALLLFGAGAAGWLFEIVDGGYWVIAGSSTPARYFWWTGMAAGVLQMAYWALGKIPSSTRPPLETPHDDVVKGPRPTGAAARMACRKCGELVETSTLESGQCEACWVVRDGAYR